MNALSVHHCFLLAAVSWALSACSPLPRHADPEFRRVASAIGDEEYPADKIVGAWVSGRPATYMGQISEHRMSNLFRPDGTGISRDFNRNLASGKTIAYHAEMTWSYLGKNRWKINLPGTDKYVPEGSTDMIMGYKPPRSMVLRYHEGRLYYMEFGDVFVPIQNEAEARRLFERMSRPLRSLN